MPCTSPLRAYRDSAGQVVVGRGPGPRADRAFEVACGQCMSCRIKRSREWAIRLMHERQLHDRSCFLTLTYDDDHLPEDGSLDVRDFQKFLKRVRRRGFDVRYFHCGEYGPRTLRPHYHAAMFGVDFRDGARHANSKSGEPSWESPALDDLWPLGIHQVSDLTFDSACYVAKYITKKVTGLKAEQANSRVSLETGEVWSVKPPYTTMSLKPPIAGDWFKRFQSDVFPHDFVVAKGQKFPPPKFYTRQMEKIDQELVERLKADRIRRAEARSEDETPERRRVRDRVVRARMHNDRDVL